MTLRQGDSCVADFVRKFERGCHFVTLIANDVQAKLRHFLNVGSGVEVCAFDNRGIGRSSIPSKKFEYTTKTMASDVIALMDHLGWKKAHVFGHSMGPMIACKLASMVPARVLSLALLNVTGGGYECIPKIDRQSLSIAIRFLRAKTPEQRAAVDLDTHYSQVISRNSSLHLAFIG
ncbi:uncharacterized protein, partial [Primulina eburnea]|uniref:uncharacterized protein n=1 Tax=Primulina eburnea TaxID=1245227 RepID=UPI003C6C747C